VDAGFDGDAKPATGNGRWAMVVVGRESLDACEEKPRRRCNGRELPPGGA